MDICMEILFIYTLQISSICLQHFNPIHTLTHLTVMLSSALCPCLFFFLFFRLFLTWHWAGFVTQSWQLCCWINYKGIITLHVTKSLFFLCKGPSSEACLLPRNSAPPVAALPRKGSIKLAASGVQVPSKPAPASPVRLPKDCHRSLGDLKVSQKILDGRAVSWQI